MSLTPPVPNDWVARYNPQPADFNTYVRDTFNFLAGPPRLRAVANAVQSGINPNVWTGIILGSVVEDNYSGWTALGETFNAYAAPVPGWHGITYMACMASSPDQYARIGLQYRINGNVVGPFEYDHSQAGTNLWTWDCYDEVYLNAGDLVQPMFISEYSSSISTSLSFPSSLEIVWLSE